MIYMHFKFEEYWARLHRESFVEEIVMLNDRQQIQSTNPFNTLIFFL